MKGKHNEFLRKGRYSTTGHIYLITTVTHQRKPLFTQLHLARTVVKAIYHQDTGRALATLAYVLMPDHLHWLFQLRCDSLNGVMRDFKGFTSRRINQQLGTRGKVWQAAYHDHALRDEEDVRRIARYIVANPLRAGLVERVEDYPHWDAIWLGGGGWV
jgi:REP element-mobilizing transposase RayT